MRPVGYREPRRAKRATRWVAVAAITLVQTGYAVGCVDGMTPDCSDASTHCGPDLDGTVVEAQTLPESSPPVDGALDAVPEAGDADADADAGDGG